MTMTVLMITLHDDHRGYRNKVMLRCVALSCVELILIDPSRQGCR